MSTENQPSEYQQRLITTFCSDPRFKSYEELLTWAQKLEAANEKAREEREEKIKSLNGKYNIPYKYQPSLSYKLPPKETNSHVLYSAPYYNTDLPRGLKESCIMGIGVPKPLPEKYHTSTQRALRTINRTFRNFRKIFNNQ